MTDNDNKDKKNFRKSKVDSKKNRQDDYADERRFERKIVKGLKNRMQELEADEKMDDWNNEIY